MGVGHTSDRSEVRTKCRILVVDDHVLIREGLADLINRQQDLSCCGTASNQSEAELAVIKQSPDVVLLDLRLGREDGLELVKDFTSRFPGLRILVLSQSDDSIYAGRVLRAGAQGYLMKEQATEEVLNAIRAVASGETYCHPRVPAVIESA